MASKKFESVSGGHVRIFRQDAPSSIIDIDEGGSYETEDKGEIQALQDSTEVREAQSEPSKDVFGDRGKK
jgi:hypothetical protein